MLSCFCGRGEGCIYVRLLQIYIYYQLTLVIVFLGQDDPKPLPRHVAMIIIIDLIDLCRLYKICAVVLDNTHNFKESV